MDDFATLSLKGSGLVRAPRVSSSHRRPDYLDRFDSTTLWLDAIWSAGRVRLICPRLNNLKKPVTGAVYRLDGQRVPARFRHYDRHSLITLTAEKRPSRVQIEMAGWKAETHVHAAEGVFDGRNVLMTLSRNNDPAWIEDWARYHVVRHGADAALFVDNGSDTYGPEVIRSALARAGLARITLLTTPLPYGPRGLKPFVNAELFLQTGVMNALQYRFLQGARAVLNCDVDELVDTPGRSVFDMTARSRFGYLSFPGHWVHMAPDDDRKPAHARHVWTERPSHPCPDKWCIVPGGPLRGFQWRPHRLERLPFRRWFRVTDARYHHCRSISTGWKSLKRMHVLKGTVHDPALARLMEETGLPPRIA